MEDMYDIGVDIGEGKDYGVATLFVNGECRPIALSDTISFGGNVGRSGYVGVDMGEYTLSPETVNKALEYLTGLSVEYERLSDTLDKMFKSWNECNVMICRLLDRFKGMKRRKTTYRTIRRDCAKRNRHK